MTNRPTAPAPAAPPTGTLNQNVPTRADARFLWSCIPADCKTALATLKHSGDWETARPVILREAEAGLKLIGSHTLLDVCASLELAAQHYLEDSKPQEAA